jgi:hypothetical protein
MSAGMRRSSFRRVWLLVAVTGALIPLGRPVASAQVQTGVVLRMKSQSVWNGPGLPLKVLIRATNETEQTLDHLTVVLTIGGPVRSRSVYEESLTSDPTSQLFAYPFPQTGTLGPGESRVFLVRQPLDFLQTRGENVIYPLRLTLLAKDTPVATIRTPMIYLFEPPTVHLNLTTTWVFDDPIQFGPDQRLLNGPVESDIAPGGRLSAMADALNIGQPQFVDVVVSPVLVAELARMAQGYQAVDADGSVRTVAPGSGGAADAARLLSALQKVAGRPRTELGALPYGDASIPMLYGSGLGRDFGRVLGRGREVVETALGASVSRTVFRPPYSQIDPGTVQRLAERGYRTLLVDPGILPDTAGQSFAPPPVVRLSGREPARAIRPAPEVAALADTYRTDPRLAAQAALGELAAIYFEYPGRPGRGSAVTFPEGPSYPASFFPSFAALISGSPWLKTVTATQMVALTPNPETQVLAPKTFPHLSPAYVDQLRLARQSLGRFEQTFTDPRLASRLQDQLLLAEGQTFVPQPALGARFIAGVQSRIHGLYRRVRLDVSQLFTLIGPSGKIPVGVDNESGQSATVLIRLISDHHLLFPEGATRTVTFPVGHTPPILFPVHALGTGRFQVKVQVETVAALPNPDLIAETELIVRSTAYNRVALILTIGAAVFLLLWWGRRFLPRHRT